MFKENGQTLKAKCSEMWLVILITSCFAVTQQGQSEGELLLVVCLRSSCCLIKLSQTSFLPPQQLFCLPSLFICAFCFPLHFFTHWYHFPLLCYGQTLSCCPRCVFSFHLFIRSSLVLLSPLSLSAEMKEIVGERDTKSTSRTRLIWTLTAMNFSLPSCRLLFLCCSFHTY